MFEIKGHWIKIRVRSFSKKAVNKEYSKESNYV